MRPIPSTPASADPATSAPRRILLIDLDWQDADRLPELFRRAGVSVRLVAGDGAHDPGVRMADLCGLPRTLDLADLTREIFDLALVGERSSRRTQLASLLVALGTPYQTPAEFLRGRPGGEGAPRGVDVIAAPHAAMKEQAPSPSLDAWLDQAIPDLTEVTTSQPAATIVQETSHVPAGARDASPANESSPALEAALKALVARTGAGTAELHAGDRARLRLVTQVGPEDRLLKGLIDLANELGTPQLVTRLSDPGTGRTWAAWPFRTLQRRGVLAVASIDATHGVVAWQVLLEDLRITWDREDHARSAAAFPLTPEREQRWLEPHTFRERVGLAIERHRGDGLRFALHRLEFPDAPQALRRFVDSLPGQLRDTDSISRPLPRVIVLLTHGEPRAFRQLRLRLLEAWKDAWRQAEMSPPAAAFVDRHVALSGLEDIEAFRAAADLWMVEQP